MRSPAPCQGPCEVGTSGASYGSAFPLGAGGTRSAHGQSERPRGHCWRAKCPHGRRHDDSGCRAPCAAGRGSHCHTIQGTRTLKGEGGGLPWWQPPMPRPRGPRPPMMARRAADTAARARLTFLGGVLLGCPLVLEAYGRLQRQEEGKSRSRASEMLERIHNT